MSGARHIIVFVPLQAILWIWLVSAAQAYEYTHEVLPGESLLAVAKRYHVTPKQIRRKNRLRRSHLRAGEKLKIVTPVPCRPVYKTTYRARRGDSPARVAKKFKMKLALLRRLNPRLKRGPLKVGQAVYVVREGPRPGGAGEMYRLMDGPGYVVRNASRAWGTFLTVTRLMEVLADHARRFPKATPLRVDDISKKGGGRLAPHASHRRGRDVDIGFPLSIKTDRYVAATPKTLDVERTWDLVHRFIQTDEVVYIFVDYKLQRKLYEHVKQLNKFSRKRMRELFQYPRRPGAMVGIIRHEPGHSTHMHVRFVHEKRTVPTS
jgi:LysM repeat protein